MPPPKTRVELERNVYLLIEEIRSAKERNNEELLANRSFFTFPHLRKLRYFPNLRMVIGTINEPLRNQANMSHWMELTRDQ